MKAFLYILTVVFMGLMFRYDYINKDNTSSFIFFILTLLCFLLAETTTKDK